MKKVEGVMYRKWITDCIECPQSKRQCSLYFNDWYVCMAVGSRVLAAYADGIPEWCPYSKTMLIEREYENN